MNWQIGQWNLVVTESMFRLDFKVGEIPIGLHITTATQQVPTNNLWLNLGGLKLDIEIPEGLKIGKD